MEAQIVAFRSSAPATSEAQFWASVRESLRRYSATPIGADIVRLSKKDDGSVEARPYARIRQLREGDTVELDKHFFRASKNLFRTVQRDECLDLYIEVLGAPLYLYDLIHDPRSEVLVGVYRSES